MGVEAADSVEELLVTGNVAALVFALAGGVLIPDYADPLGNEIALLAMLNANQSTTKASVAFLALPPIEEIFRLIGAAIEVTDRGGAIRLLPQFAPEGSTRLRFSHSGRGERIGASFTTTRHPSWIVTTKDDVAALSYVHVASMGFRRWTPSWRVPPYLGQKERGLGANMHKPSGQTRCSTPCTHYVQGPSNADACLNCGLSTTLHPSLTGDGQLAGQLKMLEDAMAEVRARMGTPASPISNLSADSRARFSPVATSNLSSDRTTNAILAQPAQRLLSWSKFEYSDWKTVRDAAKLAYATGTRDHQRFHLSEDMEYVLSAYCDKHAGNLGDKSKKGLAFKTLNELPLDEWIKTVDAMMRINFKVPEFDKLELDLMKDEKGRPSLDAWRAAWIIFEQQENYLDEKDRLQLLRDSVEKNFKEATAERLEPEYKRWRRDKTPLLEAIFGVCDVVEPLTNTSISFGKTGGAKAKPKGWKNFFCVNCKANDTHDTADCTKTPTDRKRPAKVGFKEELFCLTCKATDHKSDKCPKKSKEPCTLCKKVGHPAENCFYNPSYKPPAGYICKSCGKAGHFVQQCKANLPKK